MEELLLQLPGSPGCFICDNNGSNHRALQLKLLWNEKSGTVSVPCEPDETWCGFNQVVHGGLVATVLDEALGWAVKMHTGDWAFTADLQIRYKKAVTPGRKYVVEARVTEDRGRKINGEAAFLDDQGLVLAEAVAVFLPAKGRARPRSAED